MGERITAYHGTGRENAAAILASGEFREGTWFAFRREDALRFGGPVVFEVLLDSTGFRNIGNGHPHDGWQFFLRDSLSLGVSVISWPL